MIIADTQVLGGEIMKNANNTPSIYTVTEVMKILKCSRANVYNYISQGLFPSKRIDRKHRIPVKPFLDWLYSGDNNLEA